LTRNQVKRNSNTNKMPTRSKSKRKTGNRIIEIHIKENREKLIFYTSSQILFTNMLVVLTTGENGFFDFKVTKHPVIGYTKIYDNIVLLQDSCKKNKLEYLELIPTELNKKISKILYQYLKTIKD